MYMSIPRLNCVRLAPTTMRRRSAIAGLPITTPSVGEFMDMFVAPHQHGVLVGFSSPRIVHSSSQRMTSPLPETILYDGPSWGKRSRLPHNTDKALPTSLPPPVIFDGPARRKQ